ncbi:MAG: LysM peptidoglycan-binding domain-containing protein, partial [Actinomycetota bacterium]
LGPGAPRAFDPNAWRSWLRMTPMEDVVVAVLQMIALALSWWLLISTAACLAARARGIPPAVRAFCRMAAPAPLRRLIDRAAAMSTAVSLLGAVAGATPTGHAGLIPEPTPLVRILDGQRGLIIPPGGESIDGRAIPDRSGRSPSAEAASLPPSGDAAASALYVVQPGDNLWKIAATRLRQEAEGSGVTNTHIHGYWTEVVKANLSTLPSRNPNLIRTGETITLPSRSKSGG